MITTAYMEFDNDRKIPPLYKTEILFWIMLVLINPLLTTFTLFRNSPSFFVVLFLISMVCFPVYLFFARVAVPRFLFRKKYLYFAIISVAVFIFLTLLLSGVHSLILQFSLDDSEQAYVTNDWGSIIRDAFWTLTNMSLCVLFAFVKKTFDDTDQITSLQKDNTLFRLKYLQSQLNPHFLFNTLNSIYSLSLQKSDQAPDVIIKLADIMRYLIYECNEQKIALDKEIDFIRSYIEIEKIRYKADIRFIIEGETKGIDIEPFLFISFIENGFKHAMNEACANPFIYITIKVDDQKIELNVVNNTNIDLETQAKRINGTGIRNSRSLLELLYPESHALNIIQTDIQARQNNILRMKHAHERLKMYYPDKHTLDAILNNNAYTVSLVVNPHAK